MAGRGGAARLVAALLLLLLAALGGASSAADADASGAADAAAAASASSSAAEEAEASDDDEGDFGFDENGESFDRETSPGGGAEEAPDFDEGLPEAERAARLRACVLLASNRLREPEGKEAARHIMNTFVEERGVETDQAKELLLYSWIMTCYMNSDESTVAKAVVPYSQDIEREVFSQRPDRKRQAQTASTRQWQLLQSTLLADEEELRRQERRQQRPEQRQTSGGAGAGGGSQASDGEAPLADKSLVPRFLLMLLLLLLVFGVAILAVMNLMRRSVVTSKSTGKSSTKSALKAGKAERRLDRKRF